MKLKNLFENSLFSNDSEKTDLINDKKLLASSFWIS